MGSPRRVYNRPMAKGDFSSLKIDSFSRGLNLVDPIEELDVGYLGPNSVNVLPVGAGKSISVADGLQKLVALPASTTKRPLDVAQYPDGIVVVYDDGSADMVKQFGGTIINICGPDSDISVVVSQDSALSTYYIYMVKFTGSAVANLKAHAVTGAVVTWPGSPPKGEAAISWKTMMIIGSGNRVRFSTQGNPDSWPANNFIDIKTLDDAQDSIVGFEILGENLIVFKKRSVWMVFDPVTFENRRLFSVGLINNRATCRLNDRIYWVSHDGVFSTDGDVLKSESGRLGRLNTTPGGNINYDYISMAADPIGSVVFHIGGDIYVGYTQFRDFEGNIPWYKVSDATYATVRSIIFSSSDFITAGLGSNNPVSNYLLGVNAISTNENFVSKLFRTDGKVSSGTPHTVTSGSINMKSTVELPTFHNKDVEGLSRLRRLDLYGHGTIGSTANAKIEVFNDNSTVVSNSTIVTSFINEFLRLRPEMRAKNFKVVISSEAATGYVLHTVEAEFRGAGR
jgi:hypothetical protein